MFADIVWSCVYKLCTLCLQCNREAVCLTNTCVWLMCKWYLGMCVARFIYTFYLYIELYSHVLLLKRFALQLTNSIIVIFLVITNPLHVSVVLFLKVDLSWYIYKLNFLLLIIWNKQENNTLVMRKFRVNWF